MRGRERVLVCERKIDNGWREREGEKRESWAAGTESENETEMEQDECRKEKKTKKSDREEKGVTTRD